MRPAQAFWNRTYSNRDIPPPNIDAVSKASDHFGDVRGKTLLDIGSGQGENSLYFASLGANVIAIDFSEVAIAALKRRCIEHGVGNIRALHMSAMDITALGTVDLVFGSMILHHLEPFSDFSKALRKTICPTGKAFFFENNATKPLVWARNNLVGKYGIPKYGDDDEFPLTPCEVNELRKYFHVELRYPELMLFGLVSCYLLRGHFSRLLGWLDRFLYEHFPSTHSWSYRQYLYLSPQIDSPPIRAK